MLYSEQPQTLLKTMSPTVSTSDEGLVKTSFSGASHQQLMTWIISQNSSQGQSQRQPH